jgi:enamine deaminase RidA (YjgF/YER057c/UK114 family)
LTDIKDVEKVNAVYKTFFKGGLPARTVVQVAQLFVPYAKIEIEATAFSLNK